MQRRTFTAGMTAFGLLGAAGTKAAGTTRSLIIFYSRKGENYAAGKGTENLTVGHTARVAQVIAAATGADIFEVETAEPYPAGYRKTTEVVQDEFDRKIFRALKRPLPELSAYDTVFIGHPIWWGRIPPFFYKALSEADLSGKNVVHFVTHGGSGFGSSDRELHDIAPKAHFLKGLALYGEEVESSEAEIKAWLKELKLTK